MIDQGFVVVDCETTGLNPAQDRIIQVALLKWLPSGETALNFFVNPGRAIPPSILTLTGLRDIDFTQCPKLDKVSKDIVQFIGALPVVGHNVTFDRTFLDREGISLNDGIDTLEWARVALPLESSYRLSELMRDQSTDSYHDARFDVKATRDLVFLIRQQLGNLPPSVKADLAFLMGQEWDWWHVSNSGQSSVPSRLDKPEREPNPPDRLPVWEHQETSHGWMGPSGPIAKRLAGFESRESQGRMVKAIETALQQQSVLMVEAGTGTGKSMAYLTPMILEAGRHGARVVIATHTLALQEQLWTKDLPIVAESTPLHTAVLKGRGRYLCLLKLDEIRHDTTSLNSSREDRLAVASLLCFAVWSHSGDIDAFNPRTEAARKRWQDVVAERNACAGSHCAYAGSCYLRQSRRLAEFSHVVVINHALLATHLQQGGVLPPFDYLVIDEAHHFADVVEHTLGMSLDIADFVQQFEEADQGRHGIFQRLPQHSDLQPGVEALRHQMRLSIALLWQINGLLTEQLADSSARMTSRRVTKELWHEWQGQDIPELLKSLHNTFATGTQLAHDIMAQAEALFGDMVHEDVVWLRYGKWTDDLLELTNQIGFWGLPELDWVSWWEVSRLAPSPTMRLRRAPIDVATFLKNTLWDSLQSAVLTSATLSIRGDFSYYQTRLGIPQDRLTTLALPTPFDVPRRATLLLPTDLPPVNDRDFVAHVGDFCVEAAQALGGKSLILFTANQMLRETNDVIRDRLTNVGIRVIAQGIDGTGPRVVEQFRQTPHAVLLGSASLWEGVDIPGPALSLVVVVRLPFANPTDPMEEARRERIESQGRSAFYQHGLPQAILRFQQGFGRLLRTQQDQGFVVVLDGRILPDRTRYGRHFAAALPDPAIAILPKWDILEVIKQFGSEASLGGQHAHSTDKR